MNNAPTSNEGAIAVEVCVDCSSDEAVRTSARNACVGGAERIELCRDLSAGGLTPERRHIEIAREAFGARPGVLVMIRPRPGGFAYDADELDRMATQISDAEAGGADGVVLGALHANAIAVEHTRRLVDLAHGLGLAVTFHRAFDDTRDSSRALESLVELEVDRVLTSGTPWGSGRSAMDGIETIASLCVRASGRIEVVVGGGVTRANARTIVAAVSRRMATAETRISVHAHSDLLEGGVTDEHRVAEMVRLTRNHLIV